MTLKTEKTLTAILRKRQQEDFIGRKRQSTLFERNLLLPIESRSFVFNVSGQGGVGKTNLLRHFRALAEHAGALTAWCDASDREPPAVLGTLAGQLEAQGFQPKRFSERYKVYRQRRQELETDPEAPQGLPAFLGRTVAKTGIHLARRAPAVGVAFDFVDEETLALQAGDWLSYLARKISNKDELQLVREPQGVLTPLFWNEITEIAKQQLVVLFFDTYEITSETLDGWIREWFEARYGELPSNVIIVISGQHELDKSLWAPYEAIVSRLPLDMFSVEETKEYLARKGITAEPIVNDIVNLSGRLPLLVATLASQRPTTIDEVHDPSSTAVECFLKLIDNSERRRVALDAALPRRLNRDVLAVITSEQDADTNFAWLSRMPFFQSESWTYHSIVRTQLLRHKHRQSPQSWSATHAKLASYFENLLGAWLNEPSDQRRDPVWQEQKLELLYHQLCSAPHNQLSNISEGFVTAMITNTTFAKQWAETVQQGGIDTESEELKNWANQLLKSLADHELGNSATLIELLSTLLEKGALQSKLRTRALGLRGEFLSHSEKYSDALTDLSEAIKLEPQSGRYRTLRAQALYFLEQFAEAAEDLEVALTVNPKSGAALALRGRVRLQLKDYVGALQDLDLAINLSSHRFVLHYARGEVYRCTKRYQEALREFELAMDIEPESKHYGYRQKALTLTSLGNYKEAADNLQGALILDPTCNGCWSELIRTYKHLVAPSGVPAEIERMEFYDRNNAKIVAARGEGFRRNGFLDEALTDLDQAVRLDGALAQALFSRSKAFSALKKYDSALGDCETALELLPTDAKVVTFHGELLQRMELHEGALIDFTHALELEPNLEHKNQKRIGETQFALRKYREAQLAFKRSLTAYPECHDCWTRLTQTYEKTVAKS